MEDIQWLLCHYKIIISTTIRNPPAKTKNVINNLCILTRNWKNIPSVEGVDGVWGLVLLLVQGHRHPDRRGIPHPPLGIPPGSVFGGPNNNSRYIRQNDIPLYHGACWGNPYAPFRIRPPPTRWTRQSQLSGGLGWWTRPHGTCVKQWREWNISMGIKFITSTETVSNYMSPHSLDTSFTTNGSGS